MKEILISKDLKTYFYNKLDQLNHARKKPVSQDLLFYSSDVLAKYSDPNNLFEEENGKLKEKILGLKLLESQHKESTAKVRELKDIAETTLVLCGFFSKSIENKIVSRSYYEKIGMDAYIKLDSYEPEVFECKSFYKKMSYCFKDITILLSLVSQDFSSNSLFDKYDIMFNK